MHNTAARLDTQMSKVLMKGGYFGAIRAGQWCAWQEKFPWKLNDTASHCPSTPWHLWEQAAFKVKYSGSLSNTQAIILLHNTGLHWQLTTNIKGSIMFFLIISQKVYQNKKILSNGDKNNWTKNMEDSTKNPNVTDQRSCVTYWPPMHPHFPLPFSPISSLFPLQVADEINWKLGEAYPGKETKVCIALHSREKYHAWNHHLKKRQYEKWN